MVEKLFIINNINFPKYHGIQLEFGINFTLVGESLTSAGVGECQPLVTETASTWSSAEAQLLLNLQQNKNYVTERGFYYYCTPAVGFCTDTTGMKILWCLTEFLVQLHSWVDPERKKHTAFSALVSNVED